MSYVSQDLNYGGSRQFSRITERGKNRDLFYTVSSSGVIGAAVQSHMVRLSGTIRRNKGTKGPTCRSVGVYALKRRPDDRQQSQVQSLKDVVGKFQSLENVGTLGASWFEEVQLPKKKSDVVIPSLLLVASLADSCTGRGVLK